MKLKRQYLDWIKAGKCPCCNEGYFEFIKTDNNGILVNCHTKGRVEIPNLWIPSKVCNNPLCEWSKVDVDSLNLTNTISAWEQ